MTAAAVRIVDIRERTVAISRYADPAIPSGGLTTSIVAVVTDAVRDGKPVVGYGFASFGRFGQAGLINERFAPRLLGAAPVDLVDARGTLDPRLAWSVMMAGEKPGGHGERCVAVGTLDMALWDAAAKLAGQPLWRFLARDGGVYVQCESTSLTRGIPVGLGWLVGPFVTSIPRESLSFTLETTRRVLAEGT